jgi:hypothetical protein
MYIAYCAGRAASRSHARKPHRTKYLRIAYDTPCYFVIWEVYNIAEALFSAAHISALSGISD